MPDCRQCLYFIAEEIRENMLHVECEKKQPVMMSSMDCDEYKPYKGGDK
jgi:hypothetical protein